MPVAAGTGGVAICEVVDARRGIDFFCRNNGSGSTTVSKLAYFRAQYDAYMAMKEIDTHRGCLVVPQLNLPHQSIDPEALHTSFECL